ncbi:DUF418 domain-containing protein [Agriterribacter sp.]|uniref:DUF418 domain-containing protein n=1 Tax=Agriterribacter sp. TaxID=2821509 RepID=UPI002CC314A5|nr:DUF418 domain-containing protein [Agriterribacter sp.]HRO47416.1 DUF418 domain-containing protein [Agriterribacter sp.]HRQ16583.1 DUF418 domain-containing protein [Agriterribacter sp.]
MNTATATFINNLPVTPVSQANRIPSVDVLRGIALLGILLMNITEFSMPQRYSEAFRTDPSNVNFWVRAVMLVFFEGKMRAMFSMIFGAGILLFIANKKARESVITFLFYRRMGWLILFGLVDAHLLLWEGDILYFYGVIGMIAFLFRKMKPQYLIIALPLVAIVEFVTQTMFYQDIRQKRLDYVQVKQSIGLQQPDESQKKVLAEWREMELSFIPNDQDIIENTSKMKSGYSTVAKKVRKASLEFQTKYLIYGIWDPLALMLLGMALYKWGFFTGKWTRRKYKWTALLGYGAGLPLVLYDFYYGYTYFPNLAAVFVHMEKHVIAWINLIYPVQRILLVLAHTSLILLIFQSGILQSQFRRLAAVGQMALTNYVMQTVICTLFFFGYGLNYFGRLEYYQVFYIVCFIWLLQFFLSPLWLRYFRFGPLEWLWRSLTYHQVQPMRKKMQKL